MLDIFAPLTIAALWLLAHWRFTLGMATGLALAAAIGQALPMGMLAFWLMFGGVTGCGALGLWWQTRAAPSPPSDKPPAAKTKS